MQNQPLVSIITPCYNAAAFISETIRSVIQQTYTNWELLITDDGSTDASIEVVKQFVAKDPRIKLFTTANGGAAVARNYSIKHAKGIYIAFLDSDDVWFPKKLEKQIAFMETHQYELTYTSYQRISEAGQLLDRTIYAIEKVSYKELLKSNKIGCLTAIYNQQLLGKVYMPLIRKRQDYALWLSILKKIPYAYGLPEVLASYRVRNSSLSSKKTTMLKWNWLLFRKVENKSWYASLYYVLYNVYIKIKRR